MGKKHRARSTLRTVTPGLYNLGNNDLVVENTDGEYFGYVLLPTVSGAPSLSHSLQAPNPPLNITSSPASAGGPYDVRDAQGEKAIAHSDWSGGAGQDTLDADSSSQNRFFESGCVDIRVKGELRIGKRLDFGPVVNATGPLLSALGKYWVACGNGQIRYSTDGETWTKATVNTPSDGAITDMCLAGEGIYFCVPSGSVYGVWKLDDTHTPYEFDKVASDACVKLCYSGGLLYGATTEGVGYFDVPVTVLTDNTPVFLTAMNTVALVSSGNSVYWVVREGELSFVYALTYDPDTSTTFFRQFSEFRAGFVATCAISYLSVVYVGGYMDAADVGTAPVGWGAVYVCTTGDSPEVMPLTMIGPNPDDHPEMSPELLDNRVVALEAGDERLYIQTSRAVCVWDIDDGGYHHRYNFFKPSIDSITGSSATDSFTGLAFDYRSFACSPEFYAAPTAGGMCVRQGREALVYAELEPDTEYSFANTLASPTILSVAATITGMSVGQQVVISGHATLDGTWYVKSIAVSGDHEHIVLEDYTGAEANDAAGGAGTITYNDSRGIAIRSDCYQSVSDNPDGNYLITSRSNFHTGSMKKDFRSIQISHDVLKTGESISASYSIDGAGFQDAIAPTSSSDTISKFLINESGYSISIKLYLASVGTLNGTTGRMDADTTPVIRAVNVLWDFDKIEKNKYVLDCRSGAAEGRWNGNPEDAIRHLFTAANQKVAVTDRFNGDYNGVIDDIEFNPAPHSVSEGQNGIVTMNIRVIP